ncbi:unnamed protein product [Eruca vesicaria subsp. sativa]|uniref:Pentatricopeptide repeat-containing protein n=1 Tax=Eruca vesicaria subsp. sativa TaxID=29727 RepID=A0ABC8LPK6_ERUVS|nr:unnamed protein product [Eruca vesicaria subsp. sativa]
MESKGIAHDLYTLLQILKLGYEPYIIAFSPLINGLCLEGRASQAVELVDQRLSESMALIDRMMDNVCQPNETTYGPVLNRMCKSGNTALALDLITKMEHKEVMLDAAKYSIIIDSDGSLQDAFTLIRAHLRGGDLATSAKLIEEMKSCGFSGDASTVKMVMDMLLDGRMKKSFLDMLS